MPRRKYQTTDRRQPPPLLKRDAIGAQSKSITASDALLPSDHFSPQAIEERIAAHLAKQRPPI